jgi:hypothetical protein
VFENYYFSKCQSFQIINECKFLKSLEPGVIIYTRQNLAQLQVLYQTLFDNSLSIKKIKINQGIIKFENNEEYDVYIVDKSVLTKAAIKK